MITKTAYEEIFILHEFRRSDGRGWLNSVETISTATVEVYNRATPPVVQPNMIAFVGPYGTPQTQVKFQLKGGTPLEYYDVVIKITTSNNQKLEDRGPENEDLVLRIV